MNKNAKTALVPKLRFPEFRDSGEWEENLIKDFAQVTTGNKDTQNKIDNGKYPFFVRSQTVERIDTYTFDCEAILTSGDGVGVGKNFHYIVGKFDFHQRVYCIYDFQKGVFGKFVYYYFSEFFQKHIMKLSAKNSVDSVRMSMITDMSMFVPSYKEQQKIADCLSSLDDLISAEDKKLSALKDHKKGLMQKLFPAEGETVPEWRFPEFRDCENWQLNSIRNTCDSYSGGTPDTAEKDYYGGKIPFIRSAEIDKNTTELCLTKEGLENSSAKMVAVGDVLVALYGANSGDVALSKINGAINQAILCLKHECNNAFVYHYLSHKKQWIIKTYIQGGQGNLSGEIIKSVELCFPRLPEEQQKIVNCLSALDNIITAQLEKIEALKAHKKGLMQGLFPSIEEVEAWA